MSLSKNIVILITAIALTACGGGGGSPGTTTNSVAVVSTPPVSSTPVSITAASVVSDFIFELDKTSVLNTGSDKSVLTVMVLDKNRNVVSGVPVSVAVDSGGVFAASGLTTDAAGKVAGNITIGGDKGNRTINATITVNGIVKIASILVTGSQIAVTPVPATPSPGQSVVLNLATSDSAGAAIQNASVTLGGTAGASAVLTTDLAGTKTATFTAPSTAGTYTVVVTGLGVSTTKTILVVVAGGAGIPVAVGPVSSASLSPQPTSIPANAAGTTTNRSKLSAKFLTTGNTGLQNMRVRFKILPPALGAGETISTGDAVVYSDASGLAEADYIPGTRSSPTNGVSVRACYKATDFTVPNDPNECPLFVDATLTVAGTPLSISISDDNKMAKGLGEIAYVKQFLIQVNDAAGLAVKDSIITPSVDITHYGKGLWNRTYPLGLVAPNFANLSLAAALNGPTAFRAISSETTAPGVLTGYSPSTYFNVWCANEDKNRNGSLDSFEDTNGDGILQPRKAEIIVSYVSGNKTDANGQMLIQISYGQNMGGWLAYTLRATTGVAGSEGDASKSYITDVLQGDVANGSFNTPPFGSNACNIVN